MTEPIEACETTAEAAVRRELLWLAAGSASNGAGGYGCGGEAVLGAAAQRNAGVGADRVEPQQVRLTRAVLGVVEGRSHLPREQREEAADLRRRQDVQRWARRARAAREAPKHGLYSLRGAGRRAGPAPPVIFGRPQKPATASGWLSGLTGALAALRASAAAARRRDETAAARRHQELRTVSTTGQVPSKAALARGPNRSHMLQRRSKQPGDGMQQMLGQPGRQQHPHHHQQAERAAAVQVLAATRPAGALQWAARLAQALRGDHSQLGQPQAHGWELQPAQAPPPPQHQGCEGPLPAGPEPRQEETASRRTSRQQFPPPPPPPAPLERASVASELSACSEATECPACKRGPGGAGASLARVDEEEGMERGKVAAYAAAMAMGAYLD